MSAISGQPVAVSPIPEIDLDALARGYRFRPISRAAMQRAANAARASLDPLLDIGGGTGAHAAVWAAAGRNAVVVDASPDMATQASTKAHVDVVRGDAENLPFARDSFGLAYFHTSVHYGDWRLTLPEAVRCVRTGGRIEIWTFAPSEIEKTSLGYWFPTVVEVDTPRFPNPKHLAALLGELCRSVSVTTEVELIERTARSWVQGVRGRFVSTLQLVPEEELERGIAAFRRAYPNDDDVYHYEVRYTSVACVV
ncbi:MAG: class I SAM-dependent methyltransferase [Acidimicrobiia bacterium]|nr:class I SAM-dependent methyltransferase [Acidimicrobiia bacterium]